MFNQEWYALLQTQYKIGRNRGLAVFEFEKSNLIKTSGSVRYTTGEHAIAGGFSEYSFVASDFGTNSSFFVLVRPPSIWKL